MATQQQIDEQIELSRGKLVRPGWCVIIRETTGPWAGSSMGFSFLKSEEAFVGRVIDNGDGSFSEIVAIAHQGE